MKSHLVVTRSTLAALGGLCLLTSSACGDAASPGLPEAGQVALAGQAGEMASVAQPRSSSAAEGGSGAPRDTRTAAAVGSAGTSAAGRSAAGGGNPAAAASGGPGQGAAGAAGTPVAPAAPAGAGAPAPPMATAGSQAGAASQVAQAGGAGTAPSGGTMAQAGAAGDMASHTGHGAPTGGSGPTSMVCGAHGEDTRDASMSGELVVWDPGDGNVDLLLPRPVRDWLSEGSMLNAHGAWHGLRQCEVPRPDSEPNICNDFPRLVAAHQECADTEDGYDFLAMHRHMLQGLRQAFPKHSQLFAGFAHFPFAASDVPAAWRSRFGTGWSPQIIEAARVLEDIENQIDRFPTEGALGQFIQCGELRQLTAREALHPAMHQKWNVEGSPVALNDFYRNLANPMFWQLHGWLDHVWERYRAAKRLAPDEPRLQRALEAQCLEMQRLAATFPE